MPNHVTNKIIIHSPNLDEVLAFVKSENSDFDFNTLIPMPESLDIEESSTKNAAFVYVLTDGYKQADQYSRPFRHRKYFGSVFNDFSSWESELERSKVDFERIKDDPEKLSQFLNLGNQVAENYNKYGCSTWYQWCIKNWETKWNAYDVLVTENSIKFDTAWSSPQPVIEKLVSQFKLSCTVKTFDEGYNFWSIQEYQNGEIHSKRKSFPEDRDALASELKGYTQDDEEDEE